MLRAVSIGLGWWSDELARSVFNKSDRILIAGCYSHSAEKRKAFSTNFDTREYNSYEAALCDPGIDAVILTTPHSQHAKHVQEAAAAGKHVFVEKPLDLTMARASSAVAACRAAGVVLAVGHNRRFSAAAGAMRRLIDGGDLGTVLHAEAQFSAPGALTYTSDRWRAARTESPGGAIAALGIHMIDLLAWLLGPIASVRALAKRRATPVDIDDTTSGLFEFASGATGYLGTLFACPRQSFVHLYGTGANVFARPDDDELIIEWANSTPARMSLEPVDTLRTELEAFATAASGGSEYPVRPEEAVHNVAVMEAMVMSAAQNGAPVAI